MLARKNCYLIIERIIQCVKRKTELYREENSHRITVNYWKTNYLWKFSRGKEICFWLSHRPPLDHLFLWISKKFIEFFAENRWWLSAIFVGNRQIWFCRWWYFVCLDSLLKHIWNGLANKISTWFGVCNIQEVLNGKFHGEDATFWSFFRWFF